MSTGENNSTALAVAVSIRQALAWANETLSASVSPALDARLLLEHVLARNHAYLVGHDEELLMPGQWARYQTLVERAGHGEPIPYLTGRAAFFGREFAVNRAVLIPRPETEELTQLAITWARNRPGCHIVDVGTGSGCIAVTLACELPDARLFAVDVSPDALAVARANALRHGVAARIIFLQGDLLTLLDLPVELIAANLPYISDAEWTTLDDGVKSYEPVGALRGGPDGLLLIRRLLEQAAAGRLRLQGAILLEIGWRQGEAARRLAKAIFPQAEVALLQDLAGQDRLVKIQT